MDDVILRPFNSIQSYQDNGLVIMKSCVQWNPVYGWKEFRLQLSSNSKPAHNSVSFRKVDENGKVGRVNNILMCTCKLGKNPIYIRITYNTRLLAIPGVSGPQILSTGLLI